MESNQAGDDLPDLNMNKMESSEGPEAMFMDDAIDAVVE